MPAGIILSGALASEGAPGLAPRRRVDHLLPMRLPLAPSLLMGLAAMAPTPNIYCAT